MFAGLMHLGGLLATLGALWSFGMFVWVASEALVVWNLDGYRRATFTVAWVVFEDDDGSFAEGRVDGRHEVFSLQNMLPVPPSGWDDLEAQVKPGQRFDVLYNPTMTRTTFQGRKLYLLPARADFPAWARRRLLRAVLISYGPLLIGLGACVGFGLASGRSPAPWLVMTFFFLGGQALAAAVMVGTEMSQPPPLQATPSPGPS